MNLITCVPRYSKYTQPLTYVNNILGVLRMLNSPIYVEATDYPVSVTHIEKLMRIYKGSKLSRNTGVTEFFIPHVVDVDDQSWSANVVYCNYTGVTLQSLGALPIESILAHGRAGDWDRRVQLNATVARSITSYLMLTAHQIMMKTSTNDLAKALAFMQEGADKAAFLEYIPNSSASAVEIFQKVESVLSKWDSRLKSEPTKPLDADTTAAIKTLAQAVVFASILSLYIHKANMIMACFKDADYTTKLQQNRIAAKYWQVPFIAAKHGVAPGKCILTTIPAEAKHLQNLRSNARTSWVAAIEAQGMADSDGVMYLTLADSRSVFPVNQHSWAHASRVALLFAITGWDYSHSVLHTFESGKAMRNSRWMEIKMHSNDGSEYSLSDIRAICVADNDATDIRYLTALGAKRDSLGRQLLLPDPVTPHGLRSPHRIYQVHEVIDAKDERGSIVTATILPPTSFSTTDLGREILNKGAVTLTVEVPGGMQVCLDFALPGRVPVDAYAKVKNELKAVIKEGEESVSTFMTWLLNKTKNALAGLRDDIEVVQGSARFKKLPHGYHLPEEFDEQLASIEIPFDVARALVGAGAGGLSDVAYGAEDGLANVPLRSSVQSVINTWSTAFSELTTDATAKVTTVLCRTFLGGDTIDAERNPAQAEFSDASKRDAFVREQIARIEKDAASNVPADYNDSHVEIVGDAELVASTMADAIDTVTNEMAKTHNDEFLAPLASNHLPLLRFLEQSDPNPDVICLTAYYKEVEAND